MPIQHLTYPGNERVNISAASVGHLGHALTLQLKMMPIQQMTHRSGVEVNTLTIQGATLPHK